MEIHRLVGNGEDHSTRPVDAYPITNILAVITLDEAGMKTPLGHQDGPRLDGVDYLALGLVILRLHHPRVFLGDEEDAIGQEKEIPPAGSSREPVIALSVLDIQTERCELPRIDPPIHREDQPATLRRRDMAQGVNTAVRGPVLAFPEKGQPLLLSAGQPVDIEPAPPVGDLSGGGAEGRACE